MNEQQTRLLEDILQELRRLRYSLVGADQNLEEVDRLLSTQSKSASTESASPDSVQPQSAVAL